MVNVYKQQVNRLTEYIKKGETAKENFKLGLEMEHFVLHKDNLKAVPYYGNNGVGKILEEIINLAGWNPIIESGYLLGAQNDDALITLEPGGQLELSISPQHSIYQIEEIYLSFLINITPILEEREMLLIATGYQPVSKISEIPLLPKKRYSYMYDYFSDKGIYAHHMMKGTAATQLSIDYKSEEDYHKKIRIISFLSPVFSAIFDNSPFFEGKIYQKNILRSVIWGNCDHCRCGLLSSSFSSNYNYNSYVEYLLNIPPIIILQNNKIIYTGDKLIKDVFNPLTYTYKELNHLFTMAFPDIRTKNYIEIRVGDSLPYPYNLGYIALWKGLLYDDKNLQYIYTQTKKVSFKEIINLKNSIIDYGPEALYQGKDLYEIMQELLTLASNGLGICEKPYLKPIIDLVSSRKTPKEKTLKDQENKYQGLNWCQVKAEVECNGCR